MPSDTHIINSMVRVGQGSREVGFYVTISLCHSI